MKFGIGARLYAIVGVVAAGLVLLVALLLVLEFGTLKNRRYLELKGLIETALSTVKLQYALAQAGTITEAEAKARAIKLVGALRYQDGNYFWINDLHPTMVMHPEKPELDGKDISVIKDPSGKAVFVAFVDAVKRQPGGSMVDYMWPKPGFDRPVEKSSYVALFEPWGWVIGTGVYNDDIQAERNHAMMVAFGVGAAVVMLIGGLAFGLARSITVPLGRLNAAMLVLAEGNFDVVLPGLDRQDEVGQIASAVETFKLKAAEKAQAEAGADLVRRAEAERDAAAARMADEFEAAVGAIVASAAAGDFSRRVDVAGKTGLIFRVGGSVNTLCESVAAVLGELTAMFGALAQDDLTRRIAAEYQGEFAVLKDSANATAQRIAATLSEVKLAAAEVANAAAEIATSTVDLSQRTEQQAAGLEQTAASMQQVAIAAKRNAEGAGKARRSATETLAVSDHGRQAVADAVAAVAKIEESSREISQITGLIDEIARQTNLLALNAAVEAARAGDAGLSFGVVAAEVRNLAQRSSQAAKDIKRQIVHSEARVGEGAKLVAAAERYGPVGQGGGADRGRDRYRIWSAILRHRGDQQIADPDARCHPAEFGPGRTECGHRPAVGGAGQGDGGPGGVLPARRRWGREPRRAARRSRARGSLDPFRARHQIRHADGVVLVDLGGKAVELGAQPRQLVRLAFQGGDQFGQGPDGGFLCSAKMRQAQNADLEVAARKGEAGDLVA